MKIQSPCIRNCCLNEQDVCLGCYRHINEITGWNQASEERKKSILLVIEKRQASFVKSNE